MAEEKQYVGGDEITLKELILKLQEYFWEVVRNWKWVLLITIPFVAFFLYRTISTPVTYYGELTFMVNEDDGNSMGGVSAILGQIGLGGGRRKNNLDKILELAKSKIIVKKVVFDSIKIGGKEDFLGNHIIRLYDFHEEWEEDTTGLKKFLFTDKNFSTLADRKAFKTVYGKLIGGENIEGILSTGYREDTGIMNFSANSINEQLTAELCINFYDYLSDFYITKTVEKQQQTYNVMSQKVDSVKTAMRAKEYQLANFADQHRGLYTAKDRLKEIQLKRDVKVLNEMYGVTLKNFEIADFTLKNKTPYIQLIDVPFLPLRLIAESKIRSIVNGILAGLFLSILFIVGRRIYRDVMF